MLPDITPSKISKAINTGYASWDWARKQRDNSLDQFVGPRYGNDKTSPRRRGAINLIAQTLITLYPHLFPQTLKHVIRTRNPALDFEALLLGLCLDHRSEEEDLPGTILRAGMDALVAPCGVLRTGIKAGRDLYKVEGQLYDTGAIYTAYVDLDDYAIDPTAKRRGEARWEAYRWRASVDALLNSGIYDPEQVKKLPKYRPESSGLEGKPDGNEELIETVQLWDAFLYDGDNTRCVTLGGGWANSGAISDGSIVLGEYPHEGPERGPIDWISFYDVPGRIAPLPPVLLWRELHDAMAKVGDKVVRSIVEAKVIVGYLPNAIEDAKAAKSAEHLQLVKMANPDSVKPIPLEGNSQMLWEGFNWLSQQGSAAAGNIKQKAGVEGEGDTATEASILNANSDQRIKWMRDRVQAAVKSVAKKRGWYVATDPLINKLTGVRIPGGEVIPVVYTAEAREGEPLDFSFDIEPYQPESGDPNVRMRRIVELFSQVLPAIIPGLQTGIFDPAGVFRILSREFQNEDLDEMLAGGAGIAGQVQALQMAGDPAAMQGQPQMQGQQPQTQQPVTGPQAGIAPVRSAMAASVPLGV